MSVEYALMLVMITGVLVSGIGFALRDTLQHFLCEFQSAMGQGSCAEPETPPNDGTGSGSNPTTQPTSGSTSGTPTPTPTCADLATATPTSSDPSPSADGSTPSSSPCATPAG